jgi:hypothetical protein
MATTDERLSDMAAGMAVAKTADGLMNEHVAAAFLGYTVRALRNWRLRGGGPPYVKVSEKSIRYQRRDLQAWIDARLCPGPAAAPVSPVRPAVAPWYR